jgi:hypothetical protein
MERRTQEKKPIKCEECEELATKKKTFLLEGARRNPASAAYGKDDCSWCSDLDVFYCEKCAQENRWAVPDGYIECSTFTNGDRFKHMFTRWETV